MIISSSLLHAASLKVSTTTLLHIFLLLFSFYTLHVTVSACLRALLARILLDMFVLHPLQPGEIYFSGNNRKLFSPPMSLTKMELFSFKFHKTNPRREGGGIDVCSRSSVLVDFGRLEQQLPHAVRSTGLKKRLVSCLCPSKAIRGTFSQATRDNV